MVNNLNIQTEFLIGKMGISLFTPDKGIGLFDVIMTDVSGFISPVFSSGVFPVPLEFIASGSQPIYCSGEFEAIR